MRKIYFIDNKDSFSYNLVEEFKLLKREVIVYRNNIEADALLAKLNFEQEKPILAISPGPGCPQDSGNLLAMISLTAGDFPIFGVCLGLQALVEYFGGTLSRYNDVLHGKSAAITHNKHEIFGGLPEVFSGGRYHSLIATDIPNKLEIIAQCDNIPMVIVHKNLPIIGVQFHPESILTTYGKKFIKNCLNYLD